MDGRLTAILSKKPAAGRVKTRLCPPLDGVQAARLAEAMLRDVVARCQGVSLFRTRLFFTPIEERAWFEEAFPGLELLPQRGAGLADRLLNGFGDALAEPGVDSVVAIGSDQPLARTSVIARAHDELERGADVVLGPDLGGGYYLVGLRAPHPELFTRIRMSTPSMCDETVRLARGSGLTVRLLDEGYDIDVEEDLSRLRADLIAWRDRGGAEEPDFPRATQLELERLLSNKT